MLFQLQDPVTDSSSPSSDIQTLPLLRTMIDKAEQIKYMTFHTLIVLI